MANKPIKFKSSPHEASEKCIIPSLGPSALSPCPVMPSPALGLHDNRDRSLIAAFLLYLVKTFFSIAIHNFRESRFIDKSRRP